MERNVSKGIGGESVGGCMTTCVTGFVLEGVLCCGVLCMAGGGGGWGLIHLVRYMELVRYCGNRVKKADTSCKIEVVVMRVVER